MPLIIPLIYLSVGIALLAAIQGAILAFHKPRQSALVLFCLIALLIFGYQGASALYYQADSVVAASVFLKWQFVFLCVMIPVFVLYIAHLTDERCSTPGFFITTVICIILLCANLLSPHSARFTTLQQQAPLLFAWGEQISWFSGTPSIWRQIFSLMNLGVMIWFSWRIKVIFQKKRTAVHYILLILAFMLYFSAVWGALIDYGIIRAIYLPGFIFTVFTMMMSVRYGFLLKQQTVDLQRANLEIQTFSLAADQSPDSIVITDLEGVIQYVNQNYCRTSGYTIEETIGQHCRHLKSDQQPPERYRELWQTISNGRTWKGELLNKKKDGTLFLEALTISPICDDTGTIIRYMGIKEDITEQRSLEQQQQQTKRLELIGHLAGGVAHEVRNPLNAILSNTEALFREKEFVGNEELAPYQFHIRSQVTRLSRLMNDLLDLGRTIPETSLAPLAPLPVCREAISLLQSTSSCSSCRIALDMNPFAAESMIMADSARLHQVLLNLLENACQHSTSDNSVSLQVFLATPQTLCFQIKDSGAGIPSDKLDRVFEPFYTNRRGGTGLGLAIAKHFTEAMGGTITIFNNDPPPGCTAELHLPVC
jgi:PAS domain S-box-containing protein